MNHIKKHYVKYLIGVAIITIFGLGMYSRPAYDNFTKNVSDIFAPKTITYKTEKVTSEEEKGIEEVMKRPEFQQSVEHRAKWIFNQEQSQKYLTLHEKYNMLSTVEFGRMDGQNSELIESWTASSTMK